jgi:ClpP class serine protease
MEVTMTEVDNLAAKVKELSIKKSKAEDVFNEIKAEYNSAAYELLNIMRDHEKKKIEGGFGKVTMVTRQYFKITDHAQAMDFLKEDGTYEALRKVTAADASKRIVEIAIEDGPNKTKLCNPTKIPEGFEYNPTEFLKVT